MQVLFIVLPIISFVIFLFLFLLLLKQDKRKTTYICIFLICFSVLGGFSLYTYGYLNSIDIELKDVLYSTIFGTYNTFRMFFNEHDYEIATQPENRPYWHILFWLCHLIAIMAVNAVVLNLFGRRLIDSFRIRISWSNKEVYIIKGNDENALLLGKNIITHDGKYKKNDPNRLIIFWLEEDDDENKMFEKAARFGGIVKTINNEEELKLLFKKVGISKKIFSLFTAKTKYKIILMPNDISISDDTYLAVKNIKEICNDKKKNIEIIIITSSEWERKKIERISELRDESKKILYPYIFNFINEVDLITRQMIKLLPPYACPGLNFSNGVSIRNFNVLILGFGVMGQAALLRLVMNGQFVGSEMNAIVIDKNINEKEDYFKYRYPELKLCCKIEYQNYNVPGEKYFDYINKQNNIDYIVIAFDNDEINKQTVLEISLNYKRNGIPLPFIALISDYENNDSIRKAIIGEKIFVLGSREEIYKESEIINEKIDLIAKAVHESWYEEQKDEKDRVLWEKLNFFNKETNRATADFIDALLFFKKRGKDENYNVNNFITNINTIYEEESKNNVFTQEEELREIIAQTEHLRWLAFHVVMGWKELSLNYREKLKYLLDRNKELYRKNPDTKLHIALVPWNELDSVRKKYKQLTTNDYDFKKETFKIINNIPKYLRAIINKNEYIGDKNV